MELSETRKELVSSSTQSPRSAGEWRYLYFNLSLSSSLVAQRAISPSLDEIATAGTSGEFEIDGEGVLLRDGKVGARLRSRFRSLSEGVGLPLCQGKAVRDDGAGEERRGDRRLCLPPAYSLKAAERDTN